MRARLMGMCTLSVLWAVACGANSPDEKSESVGTMHAALSSASPHDVASVRYVVVGAGDTCDASPLAETSVALETEDLTSTVQPSGAGTEHRFADALFTLPPGDYRVCAFPTNAEGGPSAECGPAEATGSVAEGLTTEILLVSQCDGVGNGALDAITVLNDPPVIDEVSIRPSKFVETCEEVTLSAIGSDPNGDAVSFAWAVVTGTASLTPSGDTATFEATEPGDYEVQVTAVDVYGGTSSIVVPIHVTGESCATEFCHAIGFDSCPTGATEWCNDQPIDPTSSAQAQIACETCYGAPCYLESADCAGLGWGPNPAGSYMCGDPYFGFENGCSGDDGRTWAICYSYTTYGHWGK